MTLAYATPGAGRVPIAESDGKLNAGWLDGADLTSLVAAAGITIADDKFTITGSASATKSIRFEADTQTGAYQLTIDAGAQTASWRLSAPVLSADSILAASAAALTSGRVPFATTNGILTDSALFTHASGVLTLGDATNAGGISIGGAAGAVRSVNVITSGGLTRWGVFVRDATDDYRIRAYDDAGAAIDYPLTIARAAGGAITLVRPLAGTSASFSAGLTVSSGTTAVQALTATSITNSALTSGRVPFASTGGLITDSAGLTYISNVLTMGDGTGGARQSINGAAGQVRRLTFQTAGTQRWEITCNESGESGSNAGSNFRLRANDDAGATIDDPISIARVAGGAITLVRPVTLSTASTGLTIAATSGTTLTVSSTSATAISCAGGASFTGAITTAGSLSVTGGDLTLTRTTTDANLTATASTLTTTSAVVQAGSTGGVMQLIGYGSTVAGTNFGIARAGWVLFGTSTAGTVNGMMIGCRGIDKPIVFGINNTELARFTAAAGVFQLSSGVPLKLGNAYVAGAPGAATGTITVQDSTGTTYRIPVLV